jgi:hypothetical protein
MSMTKAVVGQGRAPRRSRTIWSAALVLLLSAPASRALGVYLSMDAAKGEGNVVKLCIGLDSGGQKVAGTQNDLIWDSSCANLKAGSCAAVPDSKKPLHGNTPANLQSTYRALVFALDNVDPIRDGKLYCCEFEMSGAGDGCCAVRFDRLGASDPVGTALSTTGNPDKLCLASGAAPAGAAPAAPAAAAPKPPAEGGKWLWLVLIGVAVVLVAILILRGRSS